MVYFTMNFSTMSVWSLVSGFLCLTLCIKGIPSVIMEWWIRMNEWSEKTAITFTRGSHFHASCGGLWVPFYNHISALFFCTLGWPWNAVFASMPGFITAFSFRVISTLQNVSLCCRQVFDMRGLVCDPFPGGSVESPVYFRETGLNLTCFMTIWTMC